MERILIVGAGTAGTTLAHDLKQNKFHLAGFLDDFEIKNKEGKILGKLNDVNKVIELYKITDIYISIPSADSELIRRFINLITLKKVKISIIPPSFKILAKETVNIRDLKPLDILYILGRKQVKQDIIAAKKQLRNKVVLITGTAGSIGSELTRQTAYLGAKKVIGVDWWELGIFNMRQELGKYKNVFLSVANIQSQERMQEIISLYEPDIIFHAAAYKHVPLMQEFSTEAFNNNVWGSWNMMQLAVKNKVRDFIYVSTDKAVNPVNVMGSTKRIGEMLMEILAEKQTKTKLNAVRFGNVIASSGSVIPIFQRQIDAGLPVTVTSKDTTRFFMTIEEAVQLIIQTWLLGENGEIFVLDMGNPVKIIDIAENMIRMSGKNIPLKFIGLRNGDKIHEELTFNPEKVTKTRNPKIYINKNEKDFDKQKFYNQVTKLLRLSRSYLLNNKKMIAELKKFDFKIIK